MIKVSLLMLTIDRFEITKETLDTNIKNAGSNYELELLVCDNGSQDKRIVEYISKHPLLKYHRVNTKNEGVGKAFNQLFLRSTGSVIVLLGNDIQMPQGWLDKMIELSIRIPQCGIVGMDWGHSCLPPLSNKHGIDAHWLNPILNRVFGCWVLNRSVVDEVGFFHEGYDVYGIEDSDLNERVNRAGLNSCYVPNLKSKHVGHDVGENSQYRKMKDESLQKNLAIFNQRIKEFDAGKLHDPLPEIKEPI